MIEMKNLMIARNMMILIVFLTTPDKFLVFCTKYESITSCFVASIGEKKIFRLKNDHCFNFSYFN